MTKLRNSRHGNHCSMFNCYFWEQPHSPAVSPGRESVAPFERGAECGLRLIPNLKKDPFADHDPLPKDDWSIARFSILADVLSAIQDEAGRKLFHITARDRQNLASGDDRVLSARRNGFRRTLALRCGRRRRTQAGRLRRHRAIQATGWSDSYFTRSSGPRDLFLHAWRDRRRQSFSF